VSGDWTWVTTDWNQGCCPAVSRSSLGRNSNLDGWNHWNSGREFHAVFLPSGVLTAWIKGDFSGSVCGVEGSMTMMISVTIDVGTEDHVRSWVHPGWLGETSGACTDRAPGWRRPRECKPLPTKGMSGPTEAAGNLNRRGADRLPSGSLRGKIIANRVVVGTAFCLVWRPNRPAHVANPCWG